MHRAAYKCARATYKTHCARCKMHRAAYKCARATYKTHCARCNMHRAAADEEVDMERTAAYMAQLCQVAAQMWASPGSDVATEWGGGGGGEGVPATRYDVVATTYRTARPRIAYRRRQA
jgi:hypothetical protein